MAVAQKDVVYVPVGPWSICTSLHHTSMAPTSTAGSADAPRKPQVRVKSSSFKNVFSVSMCAVYGTVGERTRISKWLLNFCANWRKCASCSLTHWATCANLVSHLRPSVWARRTYILTTTEGQCGCGWLCAVFDVA